MPGPLAAPAHQSHPSLETSKPARPAEKASEPEHELENTNCWQGSTHQLFCGKGEVLCPTRKEHSEGTGRPCARRTVRLPA